MAAPTDLAASADVVTPTTVHIAPCGTTSITVGNEIIQINKDRLRRGWDPVALVTSDDGLDEYGVVKDFFTNGDGGDTVIFKPNPPANATGAMCGQTAVAITVDGPADKLNASVNGAMAVVLYRDDTGCRKVLAGYMPTESADFGGYNIKEFVGFPSGSAMTPLVACVELVEECKVIGLNATVFDVIFQEFMARGRKCTNAIVIMVATDPIEFAKHGGEEPKNFSMMHELRGRHVMRDGVKCYAAVPRVPDSFYEVDGFTVNPDPAKPIINFSHKEGWEGADPNGRFGILMNEELRAATIAAQERH